MDPKGVTVAFNERNNSRDLEGLALLMTDDHTFIDAAGHAIRGKSACRDAWRGFFNAFPDYQNLFESIVVDDSRVVVVGRSRCSDARLDGPALWVATVSGDRVVEWRVYQDTPANRRALGIAASSAR
jgi:ketosteroid isomerase-like protein